MKNAFKNLKLWQKKRSELPISDDKNADWLEMHALLDKQMPVTTPLEKSGWLQSKKLKTIGLTFLSFSAAAMVYVVSHVNEIRNKNDNHLGHHHGFKHSRTVGDSLVKKDSTLQIDSAIKQDTSQILSAINNTSTKIDSLSLNVAKLPKLLGKRNFISPNEKLNDSVLGGNTIGKNSTVKNNTEKTISGVASSDKGSAAKNNVTAKGKVQNDISVANNNGSKKLTNKAAPYKLARSSTGTPGKNNESTFKKTDFLSNASKGNKSQVTVNNRNSHTPHQAVQHASRLRSNPSGRASNAYSKPGTQEDQNQDDGNSQATGGSYSRRGRVRHNGVKSKTDDDELADDEDSQKSETLAVTIPKPNFGTRTEDIRTNNAVINPITRQKQAPGILNPSKKVRVKDKSSKTKASSASDLLFTKLNWGIFVGVNSSGSFTSKSQNANFYGSAPADLFPGVFATYNLNAKWAINSQLNIFSPHTVSYNYTHFNDGMVESPKLLLNSSGKIYSLEVPLQLSYRINNYLSIMAGPLINIPIKQVAITNNFNTNGVATDSTYKVALADTLSGTKYIQKLNFGISTGVNIQYKRLIFGAMWNQSLTSYDINSALGTYKTKPGTFQFTIGWQLDKRSQKR